MKKHPTWSIDPGDHKAPRIGHDPNSFLDYNPSWRFAKAEVCEPFGWHKLDPETLHEVRKKLSNFETMTWSEILIVAKKRNHTISVDNLCRTARKRLQETGQSDLGQVVSLHLTGTQRVWGRLSEGVFHLLWWDPYHQICPSLKK